MSGEIPNELKLGKYGTVKLGQDKGIQRSAIENQGDAAKSIFDSYDKDKNGILDEQELAQLNADLEEYADKNLGKKDSLGNREAKKFLKEKANYQSKDARLDIQNFMKLLGGENDNVESAIK
ncbi:hypothetical protein IJF81_00105, partial [bacterium]|nr:hypothetical protein [bacterium]